MRWSEQSILEMMRVLLAKLAARGINLQLGIELEFYLRYNGLVPSAQMIAEFAKRISVTLEEERGAGQYEVAIDHGPVPEIIARFISLKIELENTATACGLTFITQPKPFPADYGSALHANISLHDSLGVNVMTPEVIVTYANSLLSLVSTDLDFLCTEEDMKRFQPGWMAPSHLAWGGNNRSTVIRVPDSLPGNKRLEFRLPGADADINRVVLFILVAFTFAPCQLEQHPKIYGNAHDAQYNLPKLQFCNSIEQSKLASLSVLKNYLQKIGT